MSRGWLDVTIRWNGMVFFASGSAGPAGAVFSFVIGPLFL